MQKYSRDIFICVNNNGGVYFYIFMDILVVQDPHIRKLNKNGRTGHGFLYFLNAIFLLARIFGR